MKNFHCQKCGHQVFFESVVCVHCGAKLGYLPEENIIGSFEEAGNSTWRRLGREQQQVKPCANYLDHGVCNWMVSGDDANSLCKSCRLTSVVPSLSDNRNLDYWRDLETAKRRLLYSLMSLNLHPFATENDNRPAMSFRFLDPELATEKVVTGHDQGVITLSLQEANPVERERFRQELGEYYRTLLGHFRHESGHYYFQRLIADGPWLEEFRTHFGDERTDYAERLARYYQEGKNSEWESNFISCYASSHPWEDWAETWAHYLHMIDTLEAARVCGVSLAPSHPREPELQAGQLVQPKDDSFKNLFDDWFALTYVINNLNRSMGMPDAYPFAISGPAQGKLRFVHSVLQALGSVSSSPPEAASTCGNSVAANAARQAPVTA